MNPITLPTVANSGDYNSLDPLDGRYYDPEIAKYLSEKSRIAFYAYVEAALAHTLAEFGVCSQEIADKIDAATRLVTVEEVYEEEKVTNHHTKALVNAIKNHLDDDAKPFVHFGATSFDIISSGEALQLKTTVRELVIPRLKELMTTLLDLTEQYADTTQIGRTHGQHGVPITFGFALAGYTARLGGTMQALDALAGELPGKFSGAVGSYNALSVFIDDPMKFEETILGKLNIPVAQFSTQIAPAEYTIRLLDELAIAAGIMANISHDMRHLQRTEIAEVRERFEPGQTGSSTMAHKRNPWNFENVISMSKQVTAQIINANMNISSEHQRDLTDSASSRFFAISIASVASMTKRLNKVMSKLEVDDEAMQRNLGLTGGAIAAEPLYLLLEKHGHTTAHEASKTVAHAAMEQGISFAEAVQQNEELNAYWQKFTETEKQFIEAPEKYYTGRAAEKAKKLASYWRNAL